MVVATWSGGLLSLNVTVQWWHKEFVIHLQVRSYIEVDICAVKPTVRIWLLTGLLQLSLGELSAQTCARPSFRGEKWVQEVWQGVRFKAVNSISPISDGQKDHLNFGVYSVGCSQFSVIAQTMIWSTSTPLGVTLWQLQNRTLSTLLTLKPWKQRIG